MENYMFLTSSSNIRGVVDDNSNPYRNMIMDAMRMNQGYTSQCSIVDEESNADAIRFFYILKDFDELLRDGYTNHSKLSIIAQVFTIKSNHRLSEASYDIIVEWIGSILLEGNRLKENFYGVKAMMKPLSLGYQKINIFLNFCMLYYLENTDLTKYRTYRHAHYKPRTSKGRTLVIYKKLRYFPITPKLQRLFISPKTLKYMTLHHSHDAVDGAMMHPSYGKA